MILVIDNYDSFAHNLARYMELEGWQCQIARNDELSLSDIRVMKPSAIVISPGPCRPEDSGISIEAVRNFGPFVPILGVCLGHQCIGEAYGAKTVRAQKPMHGKASKIFHDGDVLFVDLPSPLRGGRYHSLVLEDVKAPLKVIARSPDDDVMAVKHESFPVYGVQFHPESILTDHGRQIIANFTALALAWNNSRIAA